MLPAARTHRPRPVRRTLLTAAAALALTCGGVLAAPAAAAHDRLLSTSPADGAGLAEPPAEVVLTFSGTVLDLGAAVAVTGPGGGDLASGAPRVEGTSVVQALTGAGAGTYRVQWRVTSSDGHPISGEFGFEAQAGAPDEGGGGTGGEGAPDGSGEGEGAPEEGVTGDGEQAPAEELRASGTTGIVLTALLALAAAGAVLAALARYRRQQR